MPVIGGGDDDGIDVFASQDFTVVARGEEILAVDLLHVLQAAIVDVASGDQLDAGKGSGEFRITLAHATGADQSDLNGFFGFRHVLGLLTRSTSWQWDPRQRGGLRSNSGWKEAPGRRRGSRRPRLRPPASANERILRNSDDDRSGRCNRAAHGRPYRCSRPARRA